MRPSRFTITALALALALTPALAADGMVVRVERKALTLDGAKAVAAAAVADAKRKSAGGNIAIVDDGGNLVYFERLEPTFPAGANVAIDKARTAATFRRPTADFENAVKNGRQALLGVKWMTPLQGGIPIVVDGEVVGAIGVSGAASAQQDEELAIAGAAAVR